MAEQMDESGQPGFNAEQDDRVSVYKRMKVCRDNVHGMKQAHGDIRFFGWFDDYIHSAMIQELYEY